jgi:diguanylate cyclase (GGDEF)-like protein
VAARAISAFRLSRLPITDSASDRTLARLLASAVRATDVAARMGGDEFVALLWDLDEARARTVAERVVASLTPIAARYPSAELGMSAGVAVFPQPPATADELLKRADRALYQAKRTQKGSVTVSSFPFDPG